ncbi:hypothetical protein [Actinomadura kijaniata]|uniref:hypothetical protein n=1 Tax=Actinomadura kijaniata TaxID=46161 RepID=UPI0008371020|nr:hypothetical protein [Actinomadura kijaniata]
MTEYLGPLERVGDRWVIGDAKQAGGSYLVLAAEGMEHREFGAPQPRAVVPWSRFVNLRVKAAAWAWQTTRAAGVLDMLGGSSPPVGGPDACSVWAWLRHPYEDWSADYTHHGRRYTGSHIWLVEKLFEKTVEAKAAHRLGDPEWLGEAVARLAALRVRASPRMGRRVDEILRDLGV